MKRIIFLMAAGIALYACSKTNTGMDFTPTCDGTKSFTNDVLPIFQSNCAISGCHAAGSNNGPGALTSYQQIFNNRSAIRAAVATGVMPKDRTLSTTQKNTMLCWIDAGAASN